MGLIWHKSVTEKLMYNNAAGPRMCKYILYVKNEKHGFYMYTPTLSSAEVFSCWFLKDSNIASQNAGMPKIPVNLSLTNDIIGVKFCM